MSRVFVTFLIVILALIIVGGIVVGLNNDRGLTYNGNILSNSSSTSSTNTGGTQGDLTPGVPNTGGNESSQTPSLVSAQSEARTSSQSPSPRPSALPTPSSSVSAAPGPSSGASNSSPTVPRGFIYIYSNSYENNNLTINSGTKNVPLIAFNVQAPAQTGARIDELILGSDTENRLFNYFENFRVITPTGQLVSVLDYTYRLADWRPIFLLPNPINVPIMSSRQYLIVADLKPDVSNVNVPPVHIYGGNGNMIISSDASGAGIYVQ